jgi:hypothetical protein|tara:strand:+ start:5682 stop:6359 length:678 start_codon:yes stop_codon:yes gene_type:complete
MSNKKDINLFSSAPLDPYCIITSLYPYRYDPFEWNIFSKDMLHSLRSVRHNFPTHMQILLNDFSVVAGSDLKNYNSLVGTSIFAWQWNIFKEVRWRVANGAHYMEVLKELRRRTSLVLSSHNIKDPSMNSYYNERWRILRSELFEVYGAACSVCGRNYKTDGVVIQGDHIQPKIKRPDIALYFSNLQVLCRDCNVGKSYYYNTDHRSQAVLPTGYTTNKRVSNWD